MITLRKVLYYYKYWYFFKNYW